MTGKAQGCFPVPILSGAQGAQEIWKNIYFLPLIKIERGHALLSPGHKINKSWPHYNKSWPRLVFLVPTCKHNRQIAPQEGLLSKVRCSSVHSVSDKEHKAILTLPHYKPKPAWNDSSTSYIVSSCSEGFAAKLQSEGRLSHLNLNNNFVNVIHKTSHIAIQQLAILYATLDQALCFSLLSAHSLSIQTVVGQQDADWSAKSSFLAANLV